jgi:hypothetical protein
MIPVSATGVVPTAACTGASIVAEESFDPNPNIFFIV